MQSKGMVCTNREVPVAGAYDVIVLGGGIAGVAAACAAAREGARVLLVERYAQLGGVASLGGVNGFCFTGALSALGGVLEQVIAGLRKMGAMGAENGWPELGSREYGTWDYLFDIAALPIVLQAVCEKYGVSLLFHSTVSELIKQGDAVTHVIVMNMTPVQAFATGAVIDCTGDGTGVLLAGGERLTDTARAIPPSLMLMLREQEGSPPDDGPETLVDAQRHRIMELPHGRRLMKVNLMGYETLTAAQLSQAEISARRQIPRMVAFAGGRHGKKYSLEYALPILAVRESGRVRGDYILTAADVRAGRRFHDAVAYGNFTLDTVHKRELVPPYQIPLRCLIASGLSNIAVAGRCLSAEREAMSSARIMATSALCAEAAGTLAALAVGRDMPLREVEAADIRSALIRGCGQAEQLASRLSS